MVEAIWGPELLARVQEGAFYERYQGLVNPVVGVLALADSTDDAEKMLQEFVHEMRRMVATWEIDGYHQWLAAERLD